ncbi:unnamed protein product [Linum tenue]|uniref:Uncharacterized protein n=1 Tax=Linum tenue TaxID=586396 RepID=A0AAV0MBR3_9ROSI|nr:unnamed protein product [Linum tenue]
MQQPGLRRYDGGLDARFRGRDKRVARERGQGADLRRGIRPSLQLAGELELGRGRGSFAPLPMCRQTLFPIEHDVDLD